MKKGDRITIAELPACTIDRGITRIWVIGNSSLKLYKGSRVPRKSA